MNRKLLLIDGNAYIFRAFYGVRANLTNKEGQPTNAILGFKNMMSQLLVELNPSHCVVVFDKPGRNFRHEMFKEYKANRSSAPEDLKCQFGPIHEFVELLNMPILKLDGVEADDTIGSLAKKFQDQIEVMIISGDKDLTQLISPTVSMYDTMKQKMFTPEEVQEKFGVAPEMMAQYLALVGDTADNIPGAAGIGPRTAVKLLNKFGNIDGIYENTDQLAGKQRQNIESSKENVEMSLKLTQIKCDLDITESLDDFARQAADLEKLKAFYQRMNFRPDQFLLLHPDADEAEGEVDLPTASNKKLDYDSYQLIDTEEKLTTLAEELLQQSLLVTDLETTSLDTINAEIVGISFAWPEGAPVYIPVAHTEDCAQIPVEIALKQLKPIFEKEDLTLVGQNIKYEIKVFSKYGITIKAKIGDTMLESYLLEANARHNLDDMADRYLGHKMIKYEDVAGKGKKQICFNAVPVEEALVYGAEDSDATLKIHQLLAPQIKENNLEKLYEEIELPLARTLAKMEMHGVKIDPVKLEEQSVGLKQDLLAVEQAIYAQAGQEFNINSPKQLGKVLFEDLGIEMAKKKTKTGYSTNADVLEKLSEFFPIAEYILEYRSKTKLINTYLDVLPTLINPTSGRIHTSYRQAQAATGRLSSQNPNLQNIPIRTEDGGKIREAFVPEEGYTLMAADYSQIELRFLAHLSQDENLIDVYRKGGDIHTETAAAIFGVPVEAVTSKERYSAKAINFGIIYGMSAFRLSKEIGVTNKQAKAFIDAYFERYPMIRKYMEDTVAFCKEHHYVTTLFDRKRAFPDIDSRNGMVRSAAERAAINSRIQGSAADLIKIAMINVQNKIEELDLPVKMIMQVHDELVFEVKNEAVESFKETITDLMESAITLDVPLTVEVGTGSNWQEAH